MNRRKFINVSGVVSTAPLIPGFLTGCNQENQPANGNSIVPNQRSGKILIVIQLTGGNDGLNTFVPFENDAYYRARPQLSIPKQEVIKVTDQMGLNPRLSGLRSLFEDGQVSILNNVGYPNPDRSHFKSMDIWHSGFTEASELNGTGWLGRYLDSGCIGCDSAYHGIEVDDIISMAVKGQQHAAFAMNNSEMLKHFNFSQEKQTISEINRNQVGNNELAYLYKTLNETENSAKIIDDKLKTSRSSVTYPDTEFGQKLKTISSIITADIGTQIFYVSLSGFDTHNRQRNRQNKLLKIYSDGVKSLTTDLKRNGLFDDTLIMTFSEFGRRVEENASAGTDHGKGNNMILIGNKLKTPGFLNGFPDLTNLDEGDVKTTLDFRRVYATVIDNWLNGNSQNILRQNYKKLNFI